MAKPILSCDVYEQSTSIINLTGDRNVLVRYAGMVQATMYAQAQGDASINLDMCLIKNGKNTIFGTSGTIYDPDSNTFTFSCEDSNGETARLVYTAPMIMYFLPTCYVTPTRPNLSGEITLNISGMLFTGSFGVESNEIKECSYRYRETGGSWSSYIGMSYSLYDGGYNATATLTGLNAKKSYDFEFYVRDRLKSVRTELLGVRATPVFHWGESDVTFEEDVQMKKDLRLKGDSNYGNTLYFGDNEHCYITEDADNAMTIRGDNSINLDTPSLMYNGSPVAFSNYGTWTPTLINGFATMLNDTGWWYKVGNVVTVGFDILANGFSDQSNQYYIQIGYLPFMPSVAGAGGGVCSNGYMVANQNFQCFVAETTGKITLRSQACSGTADTLLQTSASGIMYPYSSSTRLALRGTISYLTNE